ncbi:MAG: PAS domain S-box protein [Terriglobales bacterium]
MKTKSPLNRGVQIGFGSAIVTLLVVGAISYRAMVVSSESDRWLRHTHEVIAELRELRLAMETVEANCRGFLLTGNESYFKTCLASRQDVASYEIAVRNLTVDNAAQQGRLPEIESLTTEKFALADKALDLRRAQGTEAAADAIRSSRAQEITTEFLGLVGQMEDEEERLLIVRDADAKRRLGQTKTVLFLGTLLGVLIAAAAGWLVRHDADARDRAVDALREGEERFRDMANNISQLAWMADEKGYIFWYNDRWFDYTGTTLADVVGWGGQETLHPDHRQRVMDKIKRSFKAGEIWEDTFPLRGRDGSYRTFLSRAVPIRDAEGKVLRWFGTNTDISETKESGAKYRGLLEAAPDAMVVVDAAGEIVLLNVRTEKEFGYNRDELVGQPVTNIIPEGFAERLISDGTRSAAEALAQQIGTGIELIGQRKDGSKFPIEIMLSPLESAEGILVTAAIRDISVRRAAEKHLGQMEGRYRGLLEAAPDAMVVVNTAGEIVLLNVRAEKQFGYNRDELVGQKMTNIVPDGFAERLIADALRSTADALAQQIGTGIELTGRHKNGSEFPIEIMLSPLESAEGILVTAAIRDISVRKQAELNLLHKIEELNRSNEELGQFAYIASHDLQEPLRMVASYTQLLSRRYKGKLDAEADEFIAFAVDGAGRMQRLIQDLLAFSRVGTKGQEMLDTSSEDALQQAIINLRGAIEESGALVTHDPLPGVLADEMQLTQLFQNLIGNGIKYQNPGIPKVHISATRNGGKKWTFAVKDNGLGIDSQYFERIFGMFQRLHKREEFAGTGIGLAICKKIVERHGGTISVESQPGQGSTFSFALAGNEKKS